LGQRSAADLHAVLFAAWSRRMQLMLAELERRLAEHAGTPEITDQLLTEIFESIVTHARAGDPEAALIVFVARATRTQARSTEPPTDGR
jgi:hypothetical protein